MAFSVSQQPVATELTSTKQEVIFVLNDPSYSGYKYQFALRVKDSSGTEVARLFLQPNNNDAAVFDISQILDSYVELQTEQTTSGAENGNGVFLLGKTPTDALNAQGGDTLAYFNIDCGYSKATTEDGVPTLTWADSNNRVWAIRWVGGDSDTSAYNDTQDVNGYPLSQQTGANFDVPFMSDLPKTTESILPATATTHDAATKVFVDYVNSQSYRLLQFAWGTTSPTNFGRNCQYVNIRWVNANGAANYNSTQLLSALGDVPSAASINTAREALSLLACGPANILDNTANAYWATAMASSWVYYDITLYSSNTKTPANQRSHIYRFRRAEEPCQYDQYTLFFGNSNGGYDAIDVNLEHEETIRAEDQGTYSSIGGNYLTANSITAFDYTSTSGGRRRTRVRTRKSVRVGTGWWDQIRNDLMESLMFATEVYEVSGTNVTRILIDESSFSKKTRNSDGLFRYTFTYSYSRTKTR